MTVHSQPLLPKLVWIIPWLHPCRERERERKAGSLLCHSLSSITSLCQTTQHCCTRHTCCCLHWSDSSYISALLLTSLPGTHYRAQPGYNYMHRFKSAKYHTKTFIIYFIADAGTMEACFHHEKNKK